MIFVSEKLENSNKLVNTVANTRINDVRYKLNAATTSDAQVEFASDPDRITHTNNGITHQHLLSSRMIEIRHGEVSVLDPPMDRILLVTQTLKSPAVQ